METAQLHFQKAKADHDRGLLRRAATNYLKAAEIEPDFLEAHYNAGTVFQTLREFEAAVSCYCSALRIRPDFAAAINNIGQIMAATGRETQAEKAFRQALRLSPSMAEPYYNLAGLALNDARVDEAIGLYRRAIKQNPEMVSAYNNLGNAFRAASEFEPARKCYQMVTRLQPGLAEGFYNLGSVLGDMGAFDSAVEQLTEALRLKPGYPEAHNNLALVYKNRGDLENAIRHFNRAIELRPDFADAYWNRSFTHLLNGNFTTGWNDYEWRFHQSRWKTIYPYRLPKPRWTGDATGSQRVLVHDEQGLGDTFQFVRYLPMVKDRCGTVILETRRAIMPALKTVSGIDELVERSSDGAPRTRYDACVPLMSLPHVFHTTLANIPSEVPYIAADPEKSALWQKRLAADALRIGIVWAGRPEHMNDRNRSCGVGWFGRLAGLDHIRWYSLQKGPAAGKIAQWPAHSRIEALGEGFRDFSDTAAAVANLDLVISVDTSVAHLAGAMGRPVWVLLPHIPDWRWMMRRQDSPWYPTMRLFRQTAPGDWGSVFAEVREALSEL